MKKSQIGFHHGAAALPFKDSWQKRVGSVLLVYTTEAWPGGGGFHHTLECRQGGGNVVLTAQTTYQLRREEVEKLPRFVDYAPPS